MSVKEPLIWFLVIGVVLFGIDTMREAPEEHIVVDDGVRGRIAGLWQMQMGREPSDSELKSLTDAWVREEVFYREAMRLGLDLDDTIIRRRLVQKVGFLIQDVNDEVMSDEQVESHYQNNIDDYTLPQRYTFSQVYVADEAAAPKLLAQLMDDGEDWRELGDATLLQASYVMKSEREILSALGPAFVQGLASLQQNEWVGPVKSSFGYHLVRLERIAPAEPTPLAFIKQKVVADLQQTRARAAMASYYDELLERYPVVYQ